MTAALNGSRSTGRGSSRPLVVRYEIHPSFAAAAGMVAAVLGGVGLFGWYSHRAGFLRAFPGLTPIVYNSALGLVLVGVGLVAVAARYPRWALPGACFAAVVGGVSVVENLIGRGLGVDEAFMHAWVAAPGKVPGRMPPNAALCFLAVAVALFACSGGPSRARAAVVGSAGSVALVLALVALFGYAADVPATYGWGGYSSIALMAALGLAVVGLGLLGVAHGFAPPDASAATWNGVVLCMGLFAVVLFGWSAALRLAAVSSGSTVRLSGAVTGATLVVGIVVAALGALVVRMSGRQHDLNARLEQQVRHTRTTADIASALGSASLDESETMEHIAELLADQFGHVCVVSRFDADAATMTAFVVRGAEPKIEAAARRTFSALAFDVNTVGLTGDAIATRRVASVSGGPDMVAAVSRPEIADLVRAFGVYSAAVAPMHSGGSLVGALTLLRTTPNPFDVEETRLLQDLADRAGLAWTNAQLHTELQATEARLRSTFADGPVGMAVIDLSIADGGQCTEVNAALCELTGYSEAQLTTMPLDELCHPDDRGENHAMLEGLSAGHRGSRRDQRLVRADGATVWARMSASVVERGGQPAYAVSTIEDVTAARCAEDELVRRALHDELTGLPNRHLLMDRLGVALSQLRRSSEAVALLYVDLDRFKDVNDSLGHEVGDAVLQQMAHRLAASVRTPDTAARVGGDEFVVVCPGLTNDADVAVIAERVTTALEEPLTVAGAAIDVGASIGVTTTRSAVADPEDLLRQADRAMYEAKEHGRHRWEMYNPKAQDRASQRRAIQDDLRMALDEHWLRLHYQPVIDLSDGAITGCEALLRIEHPEHGLLYPDAFIDIAENTDLIIPIGDWVLHEACAQLARWNTPDHFEVAINVSGRQLAGAPIADQVLAATGQAGIDPSRLTLELTERVLIEAGDPALDDLRRMNERGVGIAIDDFGTGYSSLTYLKRLPVDTVKIDRSFVAGLGTNDRDTAIVEAVTALARALGLTAIAEGVETDNQRDALRALGCQRAQGFHFARPMPADELTQLLDEVVSTWPASGSGAATSRRASATSAVCVESTPGSISCAR